MPRSERPTLQRLKIRRKAILRIAEEHGARDLRLFGSVARGESGSDSDVDFLVRMEKGRGLFDLVGFWQDLEEYLGCEVDVLTDGGISPYLREGIYHEARPL
ncbi:MAG: nucleotidyltransferase family protein [Elusimicrobiota bacterium]